MSRLGKTNENKSVHRTKRLLREAFILLLEKQKPSSINVNMLTETADVSRATFYLHYKNIEDFIDATIDFYAELFAKQMMYWLLECRDSLESACKIKNLIMTEKDMEAFQTLFVRTSDFHTAVQIENRVRIHAERILDEAEIQAIKSSDQRRVDFFFRGYFFCVREIVFDYEPKKAARKLALIFEIYDWFFK